MVDTSGVIYARSRNNNNNTSFTYSDRYDTFGVWYRSNINPEKIMVVLITKSKSTIVNKEQLCDMFTDYMMLSYIGNNQTFRSLIFNTICIIDDPNDYFRLLVELLATIKMKGVDNRTYGDILQLVHIAFYNNDNKSERSIEISNKLEQLKSKYNIRRLNIKPNEAIKRLESYLFRTFEMKSC